jgi:hypothetical protein
MPNSSRRGMTFRTLTDILAAVELARTELDNASLDLATLGGLDRWPADAGHLETMLDSLRLARAALALATAQATLGDASVNIPARSLTMALS